MANSRLKIETAGYIVGWTYLVIFILSFLTVLGASFYGMYYYISGGDGILVAFLIFFIMIVSLTLFAILAYVTYYFIKGLSDRDILRVRNFKYLIAGLLVVSFIALIASLIGATQTFKYQDSFYKQSTPPLGLEHVFLALGDFALQFTVLIIIDIIQKKFKYYEVRNQMYRENMNLNVVSSYQPRSNVHMKIPEIELPPPPSKF